MQVQIDITIIVALWLLVDSCIDHAELLADTGHQVGSLEDERIAQGLFQVIQGSLVIAQRQAARSQRTEGTSRLIGVAIGLEDVKRTISHPQRQLFRLYILRIDEFHGRLIVEGQLFTIFCHTQMLCQRLQRVGHKIRIALLLCQQEATHQMVELNLVDFCLRALSNDTTSTYII